jgi:cytochrome b561
MDYEPRRPTGYSPLQIGLHWVIAVLIVVQLVFGGVMEDAMKALEEGAAISGSAAIGVNLHVIFGIAILALAAIRLIVRLGHGAPPPPEGTPRLQVLFVDTVHWVFYGLLFAVPITGLVTWFVTPAAGDIHTAAKPVFVVLILLHVLGAVWHQFVGKDTVMQRMLVPERKRPA